MSKTLARWAAALMLGCATCAALLVPFPRVVPRGWTSALPPAYSAELTRLGRVRTLARATATQYRALQALDRWSALAHNAETTLVRLDSSVPTSVARVVQELARDQWASLGTPVSAGTAEIFVYVDSTHIRRTRDSTALLAESNAFVDVSFALPSATDGQRCVALVRLRGSSPIHINALRERALIGPCGFYAAFGAPGPAIREWLASTSFRFARYSDWSIARAPAIDASSIYSLSEPAARCLTGDVPSCSRALGVGEGAPQSDGRMTRTAWILSDLPTYQPRPTSPGLGEADAQLLADVVRSLGAERFGRFWRSTEAPDVAFQSASGSTIAEWSHQWLERRYGPARETGRAQVAGVVWLAAIIPVAVIVGARRRERVMG